MRAALANFKFQFFSFRDVAWIIVETIHKLAFDLRLGTILLALLTELLELEPLQVDLFEALHARVILNSTLEGALRDVREASERLHFEVTAIDELIDVLFVDLFKLLFESAVILRHLKIVLSQLRSLNLWLLIRVFLSPLFLRGRALVSHVVQS